MYKCTDNEPIIPLSSTEILWEWHITSDRLFLSCGGCSAFNITDHIITMSAFLEHIPPACLPTLHELWEGVLNGASGSFIETNYPFDDFLVHSRMIVLERNAEGRALRAMGQCTLSRVHSAYLPALTANSSRTLQLETGYWHCTLTDRILHLDAQCAALLGYEEAKPLAMPLDSWKGRMHPDEGSQVACRHQLVLEQPLTGDILDDTLRMRRENGEYTKLTLRGAVLERNAHGKAISISGSLCSAELHASKAEQNPPADSRLLFAINATGDGLWDWDAQTDQVYYSPRYLSMLGYSAGQFPGTLEAWKKKIHPDDAYKIIIPQAEIVESPRYGDTFECTYRIRCFDDSWTWILGRGYVTHRDASGRATRIVGLHTNINTAQNGRDKLEDLVKNDALTGLRSRTFCDMEIQRLERDTIRPVSVISCDICGLKLVNDYLGHAIGDALLRKTAMLLRQSMRATASISRMGGDEFIILLPAINYKAAQKILKKVELNFVEHNKLNEMPVFVSLGLASTESMAVPISRVLIAADKAMLHTKELHRQFCQSHIKTWIEKNTCEPVSLEDKRYAC